MMTSVSNSKVEVRSLFIGIYLKLVSRLYGYLGVWVKYVLYTFKIRLLDFTVCLFRCELLLDSLR